MTQEFEERYNQALNEMECARFENYEVYEEKKQNFINICGEVIEQLLFDNVDVLERLKLMEV